MIMANYPYYFAKDPKDILLEMQKIFCILAPLCIYFISELNYRLDFSEGSGFI